MVEAGRPDRRQRRLNGKFDALDAENAARSVLAGFATVIPKAAYSNIEMIRQLKIAGRFNSLGTSVAGGWPVLAGDLGKFLMRLQGEARNPLPLLSRCAS